MVAMEAPPHTLAHRNFQRNGFIGISFIWLSLHMKAIIGFDCVVGLEYIVGLKGIGLYCVGIVREI